MTSYTLHLLAHLTLCNQSTDKITVSMNSTMHQQAVYLYASLSAKNSKTLPSRLYALKVGPFFQTI